METNRFPFTYLLEREKRLYNNNQISKRNKVDMKWVELYVFV